LNKEIEMEDRVELQVTIDASPKDVYQALTDGEQLKQWFAEHADVSPEDSRYGFWGRLTPEAPSQENGQHRLLSSEPGELKFEWQFRGKPTTVFIEFHEEGPSTQLNLTHFGLPARQHGQYAVADFWSLSLENLRAWVERSQVGLHCDFSAIQVGEIQLEVDIDAPAERLFQILTNPEELKKYMGENPEVEPEVGGRYSFGWDSGPQKILDIQTDKKLSYSWEYPHEPDTVVTWRLEGSGGKTRLTLVHSGFAPDRNMEDYQIGWLHFLNRIKFLAEVGEAWQRAQILAEDY
jgi:uncharacterized protein YndB with AHSA1/START domain